MNPVPEYSRDRAQVGIEILIILMAIILVAAVAAGVLINTAGVLENEGPAPSPASREEVSNQIIVIDAVGQVNPEGTQLTALNLTVMQSPGAPDVDLGAATIEVIRGDSETTLEYASGGSDASADPPTFAVRATTDPDGSDPVLNERADRMRIDISLDAGAGVLRALPSGSEVTLKVATGSGNVYTYVVDVPDSLASDAGGNVSV